VPVDQPFFAPSGVGGRASARNGAYRAASLKRVRRKLAGSNDADRKMVEFLTAFLPDGLPAVEAACAEALRENVHSADGILNTLARRHEPAPSITVLSPVALRLTHAPTADRARHDSLRSNAR